MSRFFSRAAEPVKEAHTGTEARTSAAQAQHDMLANVDMAVLAELPEAVRAEIVQAMGQRQLSVGGKPKQKSIASFFKQRPS